MRFTLFTLSGVVGFVFLAMLNFLPSIGQTQGSLLAHSGQIEPRTKEMACSLSTFFSVDPATMPASAARLEGRGILNCHNADGFTVETPISADLEVFIPRELKDAGEIAISANSSAFAVPREIAQISDSYTVDPALQNENPNRHVRTVLFQGAQRDLIIEMSFSSPMTRLDQIRIVKLELRVDESAPDIDDAPPVH